MHLDPIAAPLPLFDRFSEPHDSAFSVGAALQQSLQHDLTRLFSVRNSMSIPQFLGADTTALDYGLPDTMHLSPQSTTDQQTLALVIAQALALYEPRLIHVDVVVRPDRDRPCMARLTIIAQAVVARRLRAFQFDAALDAIRVTP